MGAATAASFPPAARLRTPRDFEAVLKGGRRLHEPFLTCAVRVTQASPRLGLAISAKAVPAATDRNRIKRQVRESFRQHRTALPGLDVVMLARSGAGGATNSELRSSLDRLWQKLRDTHE